ncbi:MAG: Stk1 family PASTA domain-containing Ser/Thr kinase [Lachnospiraceae bacterium]|nr:Stk1 family PASTA domain-containing Ser/Thr kinase [Lachnospiraceae bacterium]
MLKPGMILCDRYEVLEVVGAGGMSIVYKTKDHRLNRNVAIKMLKPEFVNDKNFVTKFRIEAQASAGLTHPNIVNVYDVTEDDGIYFIVMELVEGITLKEYITENGRLPMDKAIDFSIQIASALETAHENHIIHRDIKPQNILVNKNGNLKVTDFGIAKAASANTLTSGAMGSVHYISPEQARGGYCDERSDIYSLGITMYEMVTGRVPYEGDNNVSVALMHIQNEMISPRDYYPDIYASFEKIILKATQKKPERRYLTASALIADLRRVQNNPNIDIVLAPSAITNGNTQEWSKEEIEAVRNASHNVQQRPVDTYMSNPPIQNEMGEMKPVQGISPIPVNSQRINQLLEVEDPWDYEDEEEDYTPAPRGKLKKVQDDDDDDEYDDDYDDSELDPNLKKAVVIGAVLTAVILAMIVLFVLGKVMGWFNFGDRNKTTTTITTAAPVENDDTGISVEVVNEYEMQDVVGLSEAAAQKILSDKGFTNVVTQVENNSEVQEGYVFYQSANKGDMLRADAEIVIKVSAGAVEIQVPDVVDYEDQRAVTILQETGFTVTHSFENSETVEKDKVIRTEPEAGNMAPEGSKIILVVSNGSAEKNVEVPNLTGYTQAQAENTLASKKLATGTISHENSDNVAEGYVIRQNTASGTEVPEGTAIDFVISDGPVTTEEVPATYTANIKGTVTCNNEEFINQTFTVQVINSEGVAVAQSQITVAAAGQPYDVSNTIADLQSQESFTINIIASDGSNVTSSFSQNVSTTYSEN